ncbi:MAG: choice-of-anchor tandem repeat GloVer-containing protein [Candidatus Korobacteraceae bacterium]
MQSKGRSVSSLFRPISLMLLAASVMAITMVPAKAQNSVPPTAVQSAKMPEFASRLAHPVKRPGPPKSPALARARMHRGPLDINDIYDNGPINGNTDAWTINFGFITSDSFTAPNGSIITGATFGMWLLSGDTLTSAELSITSAENGGTSYFDQTVNFAQGTCTINESGYNVCTETTTIFNGPTLNAGTYWVNLQNASVPSGDPAYWDENSGPSRASQNYVGTIPSESFTILGSGSSCPPPQTGFRELRDLGNTTLSNVPSGVVLDNAGNLYATLGAAGNYGQGLIYELAQRAGRWFLNSLYSFLGGSEGSSPNGVIVGPEGDLYGAASGGIENCGRNGSSYCGLIYKAAPPPSSCTTALCTWDETTIYQFTGNQDPWGGTVTTFDSAGNLYGYGANAIFQLSPAQGGWTEKILYSFTGGSDGSDPSSLLVGNDGNLYGTTLGGGDNNCDYGGPCGVVFQLVPSGNNWTENVLYAFTGTTDGGWPGGLVQDGSGNLYGFSVCSTFYNYDCSFISYEEYGLIFVLRPSSGGWGFGVIHDAYNDCGTAKTTFHALTIDAAGNLFAAEGGMDIGVDQYFYCGRILNVTTGTFPVSGAADIFYNLSSDANGNLYGTTATCGFQNPLRTTGMVWQYSP